MSEKITITEALTEIASLRCTLASQSLKHHILNLQEGSITIERLYGQVRIEVRETAMTRFECASFLRILTVPRAGSSSRTTLRKFGNSINRLIAGSNPKPIGAQRFYQISREAREQVAVAQSDRAMVS